MYLEKINGPEDVKKIKIDELPVLAQEIRDALLVRASKHGGHFGPNFGMVEATIALRNSVELAFKNLRRAGTLKNRFFTEKLLPLEQDIAS